MSNFKGKWSFYTTSSLSYMYVRPLEQPRCHPTSTSANGRREASHHTSKHTLWQAKDGSASSKLPTKRGVILQTYRATSVDLVPI